jgi:RecB family exonuclease
LNKQTIVFPTARAIRTEQLSIEKTSLFLPNYTTINDFITKLCIVDGYKSIDEDSRILLLLEASDFNGFKNLQIERNFFTFTKNSNYIFKFFEELAQELYEIDMLHTSDVYVEYEEHISILQELYKRYEALCLQRGVLDKIFLPKLYTFNSAYAKLHKDIRLHVDGHLTNFEFELLQKCCEFSDVKIVFFSSRFNSKMREKFLEFGIELDVGYRYTISLNSLQVIDKKKIVQNKNVECLSFSEPLLQVAYVKKKVYEFVKKSYEPQKIAVVVPDENFAEYLKLFDEKANFNFAMGESYTKTKIYTKLYALTKELDQDSKENEARLKRVGDEFKVSLERIYYEKTSDVDLLSYLQNYKEAFGDKRSVKIFDEELYSFKNILPYMKDMLVRSSLSLFLQRLSNRSLDDVRGGKITVMGVLETRSVEFDAVVIVDFSDSNVPKRSDKDMFLNTNIREMAKLPTTKDRENLQKHYYEMLINRSKEVAISFVKSTQSVGSRFLKQLGIEDKAVVDENLYANILFKSYPKKDYEEKKIEQAYSFKDKKISATALKTFLTCRRKYYYKYVKKIEAHEIPRDMPQEFEVGSQVHAALKNLYSKKSAFFDANELKKALYVELDRVCGDSELDTYLIEIQKKYLDRFCELEVQRFRDGYEVYACEINEELSFEGLSIYGQIDRIDKKDDKFFVLDYKTGKYPIYNEKNLSEASDFQLEFYYLLASKHGKIDGCAYYDLKESKIVNEAFLEEKLELLKSHINDLKNIQNIDFEMCEEVKNCMFCEYKIMCGRE